MDGVEVEVRNRRQAMAAKRQRAKRTEERVKRIEERGEKDAKEGFSMAETGVDGRKRRRSSWYQRAKRMGRIKRDSARLMERGQRG